MQFVLHQQTRYQGELLVQGNVLKDNFGGVKAYTDTNRYVGNGSGDSACSIPLGALATNSATYYQQTKVLATASDATISGSSVTSTGGTITLCADYGSPIHSDNPGGVVQAPSVGMAVYNLATNAYLGDIATVTSANAFTLNTSPGDVSGAALYVSAYGGRGPADYFGAGPGVSTGTPSAPYWDNCIWGSRNVKVSGNVFSMSASTVTGCTTANKCGYQYLSAFNAGIRRCCGTPVPTRRTSRTPSAVLVMCGPVTPTRGPVAGPAHGCSPPGPPVTTVPR